MVELSREGKRDVSRTLLLMIFTFGLYQFVWQWQAFEAMRRERRGHGATGLIGTLLWIPLVSPFLLGSYIGRLYRERGRSAPVSGWTGAWVLIPYLGFFIVVVKLQRAINEAPPAAAPEAVTAVQRQRTSWQEATDFEPPASWRRLTPATRRTAKTIFWLGVFLLLVAFFGVWKVAALVVAAVIALLVVPKWNRMPYGRYVVPVVILGLAIAYPYYATSLPQVPIFGPFPQVSTMVVMMIFTMMALGLNFVVGYAGLLDLGYVAFYAMGAYMAGWFASSQFAGQKLNFGAVGLYPGWAGFHISVWIVLLMAGIATAVVGILIGLPTLRLRGDYLAIVTLGFGEIMPQIARNGDNLFGTGFNLTNGTGGITPIDGPGFGNWADKNLHLPANYLNAQNFDSLYFWTAIVLVLITIFCSQRLRDSRLGRAWIAIREDETAAAAMGIPLMRTKTWAYATGAFFGGVAGAYYASYKSGAFPGDFFFNISVFILCMVILGGMGNIWGVIFGACFLAYLDREGLANVGAWFSDHLHRQIDVPKYEFGIFGAILVVVMLFRPEGLIPSSRRAAELHEGVHDDPLYDTEHAGA